MKKNRKKRQVIEYRGGKRVIHEHPNYKGYDVEMIQDFLDHLLLELRTMQFENVTALRQLKETPDGPITPTISQDLIEQNAKYQQKYQTALVPRTGIDPTDATEFERRFFMRSVLEAQAKRRDEQIGHLEKLQELFSEALACAKMPFVGKAQPVMMFRARDILDQGNAEKYPLPPYEAFVAQIPGHFMATKEFIEAIQSAKIVLVERPHSDKLTIVFGMAECERQMKAGNTQTDSLTVRCIGQGDMQFLLAALRKFRGRHEFYGDLSREFDEPTT